MSKVSDNFWDCIIDSGSIVIECEICHRTHFVSEDCEYYEEGEFEELFEKRSKEPDKYVLHNNIDSIRWGIFNGLQVVDGCCEEQIAKYEKFIIDHRFMIVSYLNKRAKSLREEAKNIEITEPIP